MSRVFRMRRTARRAPILRRVIPLSESERKFSHILSNLLNPTYSRDLKAYSSEGFFSKQKVLQLPKGINTHYSTRFYEDGVEFSGGEKQLLALSRALYKDSPVMILDEPTAALDPLHEKAVFDLFASQSKDKTAIYISHRMSASLLADRIILLKNGKLCESGTHRELIEINGEYAELWNMQSQWYA